MTLTDTHTHLYLEQFANDREEVIQRALDSGVSRIFLPNIDSSTTQNLLDLSGKFPNTCFPMMGLHPCSVKENFEEELLHIDELHNREKFYAVGEIGIDLYWDKTFLEEQEKAFETQILLAKKIGLPIVIHCRDSFEEIFTLMEKHKDEKLWGIFHCFSGTLEEANRLIELGGIKLGIGGIVTFKNSGLDKVVKEIPLEHIVLETDSPYLTPAPFRGKRNESAYVKYVAEKVAKLHNISIEEVAEITTANSKEVFGI